ncbi:large ribosomal subunit protein eL24-like [Leptodactylus fuscus]|uniref:large ribosomal subunit protein eL24-like n=1 Tax=Leptodactylus fuscus TaxID=238119 RepID=UPI003F4F3A27
MKVELCSFSGYKIYPGHGRRYARTEGKVFQFLNAKCKSAFLSKRNPRQINWTVLYRRKHKKGQSEEIQKKRTCRAVKFQRAITGASLAEIMAKRNHKPEVRKAQREQAIRAAKEAKKAKQATKKAVPAKASTKAAPKQKIVKPVKMQAPVLVKNANFYYGTSSINRLKKKKKKKRSRERGGIPDGYRYGWGSVCFNLPRD